MQDPPDGVIQWQLTYSGLTDSEWTLIEQLFEAVEGRLNTFTFLDPLSNLLIWSEDWTKPVWTPGPMLTVSAGLPGPNGVNNAVELTNTSQAAQRISQTISAASSFQYSFSTYVRSDAVCDVELVASADGEESLNTVSVGTSWTRVGTAVSLSKHQDGITFGLRLPAGVRLEAFGAQAEAQPAVGQYKKSIDRGGVYMRTRFASDTLRRTTRAPNQNSCVVGLVSGLS
jgi:hypothetical protein